jgi:hypothetical protein
MTKFGTHSAAVSGMLLNALGGKNIMCPDCLPSRWVRSEG